MKKIIAALLVLFASFADAQVVSTAASDSAFGKFMYNTVGAGQTTVSYGTGGTVLSSPSAATLGTDGTANLGVTRTGTINNPAGNPYTVTGKGSIPVSKLAPILKKAAALVPILSTGVALYDLANELKFHLTKQSDGSVTVAHDVLECPGGVCRIFYATLWTYSGPYNSQAEACAVNQSAYGNSWRSGVPVAGDPNSCAYAQYNSSNVLVATNDIRRTLGYTDIVPTLTQKPSTLQELADTIATTSGWPITSNLAKASADAITLTGDMVVPDTVTVTGPATSTGTTTTTTNADGSKVQTTTNYSHTYAGNTISTVNNTTTNNYNTSNQVTSTTTTAATPAATPDPQKTDCDKYPDNMGCSKFGVADTPSLPKSDSGFSQITPVAFSSVAGCPSPLTFNVIGRQVAFTYDGACSAIDSFIKPIILILGAGAALFLFVGGFKQ